MAKVMIIRDGQAVEFPSDAAALDYLKVMTGVPGAEPTVQHPGRPHGERTNAAKVERVINRPVRRRAATQGAKDYLPIGVGGSLGSDIEDYHLPSRNLKGFLMLKLVVEAGSMGISTKEIQKRLGGDTRVPHGVGGYSRSLRKLLSNVGVPYQIEDLLVKISNKGGATRWIATKKGVEFLATFRQTG